MRLRNVRGSREKIQESGFEVLEPQQYKGRWKEFFQNDNPIHIEIGMGKGKFITELAQNHPNINYIGIEKYSSVLVRAVEKRNEVEIDNLYYILMDATELPEIFEKGEVERIYLNFSDPWPKDRHAKRRLTSRQFFGRYEMVLKTGGVVEFKTDNRGLFDFSLQELPQTNFALVDSTFDLHGNPDAAIYQGNVTTEYEDKFHGMGNPICKLVAALQPHRCAL